MFQKERGQNKRAVRTTRLAPRAIGSKNWVDEPDKSSDRKVNRAQRASKEE